MTTVPAPICYDCKHFNRRESWRWFKCKAYPDGIPDEIIESEVDHTKPHKGDNGIQFEPIK
jgi:hypothetical protein